MYEVFTVPQRIHFYNCDHGCNLSLRAYLEWSVELGNLHLEARGMTWRDMQQARQVFLLSRLAFSRVKPVTYGQSCQFSTWEYGVKGAQFIRNFSLADGQGQMLAQSCSSWILVDPVERKIIRPNRCIYTMVPNPVEVQPQIERFRLDELPEVARHQVRPSQIDGNGHLSNPYYADLLSDYAPEPFQGRSIQAAQMAFDHEARSGETISLHAQVTGANSYAMYGLLPDGGRCFEAKVIVDA